MDPNGSRLGVDQKLIAVAVAVTLKLAVVLCLFSAFLVSSRVSIRAEMNLALRMANESTCT